MASQNSENNLHEIYKLAYDVAEGFDEIGKMYGIDNNIRSLIEKVISAFEMLEANVKKIEKMELEFADVLAENLRLCALKSVNNQEKLELKESFEEAEEFWLKEVVGLKTQISTLRAENEMLKSDLSSKKESFSTFEDTSDNIIKQQENSIHKLRRALNQKEKQLQESMYSVNALSEKLREALDKNKILHLKSQNARLDITDLILEKNEIKDEINMLKKENTLLCENIQELIHCATSEIKHNNKLADQQSSSDYSHDKVIRKDIGQHIKIELKLLDRIKELQSDLQLERCKSKQYEEELSNMKSGEKNQPFLESKIQQLFHLFLGVPTIFEFS